MRCFGVPLYGPAEEFCDNKSVVNSSIIPTLVFNCSRNVIYYHIVRETRAVGVLFVGWIPVKFNLVDLCTNSKMTGKTRHNLVESIFLNT